MKIRLKLFLLTKFSVLIFLIFSGFYHLLQDDKYSILRERMVNKQILARGVKDKSVIKAMKKVPRHLFVPSNKIDEAYQDYPIPIGYGQTISQPYIVAYMTKLIEPDKCKKVLEIGTGSGYQAAVLAEIIDSVYSIEIITELYSSAKSRLNNLGYKNIKLKNGDGYYGWKEYSPFDAIIVTAAAEFVPPPLIEQLKDGGKLIIPIGSPFLVQTLVLVEKKNGKVYSKNLIPVRFVPLVRGR